MAIEAAGASSYWFLIDPTGPQMSFWPLTKAMNATAPPLNIIMESKKDVDDYQHVFLEMLEPNFK